MRLACVQADLRFGDPESNAARAARDLEALAEVGVEMAVFPEAFLTGYCVETREEALQLAILRGDESLAALRGAVERTGVLLVVGFAEREGDRLYNAAALFEPGVEPRYYRKSHLPELGFDKHATPGDALEPFETRLGRIGILICFDLRHPEPSRVLALKGAELIVLPTNWPEGAEVGAKYNSVSRAAENRVFFAASDRVGREGGFRFIGQSKIVDPAGRILASAGDTEETLVADLDLQMARQKRAVIVPGKYEWTAFDSRRPELYGALVHEKAPQQ